MSRRKSTVVSPQPTTSVLRRSARLISLQSRGKPEKDLVFNSEPTRKMRQQVSPKRLVFEEGKSPESICGSSSLRPSLRGFSDSSKDKSLPSIFTKSSNVPCSCNLRRSPRFSSGVGSVNCHSSSNVSRCSKKSVSSEDVRSGGDCVKSRDRSRSRSRSRAKTKHVFSGCDDDKQVTVRVSERKRMRIAKPSKRENVVIKVDKSKRIGKGVEEKRLKIKKKIEKGCREEVGLASCTLRRSPRFSSGGGSVDASARERKSSNSVLSRCGKKAVSSERVKSGGDGVKTRDKSRLRPKTKVMYIDCDEEEEEEVSVCVNEGGKMRIAKDNEEEKAAPKPQEGEVMKTKNKVAQGWTEELELALQGAYLTAKPSPNFWKKVSKMVPGKSAQECFDRVNSDLNTPRQHQPRSRVSKTNLSPIPQFSLSASKLLKPNSPRTKIRHRRNHSKKAIRHLLEKQNHMDQGLGFDLFSVFEPGTTSNLLSTPMEKARLPKILESPLPCSRFASKDKTSLISPPVLKQVKNKALHEKYIDHLHIREAKRKAESSRLSRKENIRPVNDIQKKDSVKTVKDSLFYDVQYAIQKLKGLEAEKSSSSSDFGCETDEEDEFI